jgi:hypothetical protein
LVIGAPYEQTYDVLHAIAIPIPDDPQRLVTKLLYKTQIQSETATDAFELSELALNIHISSILSTSLDVCKIFSSPKAASMCIPSAIQSITAAW